MEGCLTTPPRCVPVTPLTGSAQGRSNPSSREAGQLTRLGRTWQIADMGANGEIDDPFMALFFANIDGAYSSGASQRSWHVSTSLISTCASISASPLGHLFSTVVPTREFQLSIVHRCIAQRLCRALGGASSASPLPCSSSATRPSDSPVHGVSAGNMQAGDFMTKVYDACKKFQKV